MAITSLTQAEAQSKISQVDDAMDSAHKLRRNIQDITTQMTTSSWQGNQSTVFAQKMQQYDDDFNTIIKDRKSVV